jgi:uncharacterized membrane protein YcaP (DUF421 family)
MKPEEIKFGDWVRILFGQVPPQFYLELIIRAFLVYLLLVVSMRLLGKRMSTQMSRTELTAMVALASAIGVPMLAFDRGILPAYIIAAIIIVINKLIAAKSYKDQNFERFSQGDIDMLVEDSVLNFAMMKRVRVSRERLFAQLRSENIDHLGKVKRVYMETNGSFSVVENEEPRPGLMVLPAWDKDFADRKLTKTNITICSNCGFEKPARLAALNGHAKCVNCGASDWTSAMEEK